MDLASIWPTPPLNMMGLIWQEGGVRQKWEVILFLLQNACRKKEGGNAVNVAITHSLRSPPHSLSPKERVNP